MRIVVLDGYVENPGDLSWAPLEALGETVIYDRTEDDPALVVSRIDDAQIVVANKTAVTREVIDGCPGIRLIAELATGYNNIDVDYAAAKGIPVVNVPAYGTQIVAQYTAGMLLEICAHYAAHDQAVHKGRWTNNIDWCFWDYPMIELAGKTAGIIGLGRIGQATARILGAMGMKVIAYNRSQSEAGRAVAEYVDMDTLLAASDVILLHCPLFPETAGMINKETIARMKDGVILINTSRGGLVIEQDLADALTTGKIYAAALDVTTTEPISADSPLLAAPNCIITPHLAWAAREARQRILDTTVDNIRGFQSGSPVNVVNGVS